ncbi:MAG TPA: HNH endonuclease signature motif containing protein [Gaiellaceae bacterium]|nr:HNH endonuclease signature motif containing protein [Gaiellaceae bacterium]
MNLGYRKYLKSIEWQRIRNRELLRANYRCERCGAAYPNATLHVHHLHYERVGAEDEGDLAVLCSFCHTNLHDGRRGDPANRPWAKENSWLSRLLRDVNREARFGKGKGKSDIPF